MQAWPVTCDLHLRRISIDNILSFKHVEFPLSAYTVIVGPNNSGKTNLLRFINMMSKNQNLEYISLNKRHKLDPNKPSEMTITLEMDEYETKMVFQCIFGQYNEIDAISAEVKILDITIFWGREQRDATQPRFTLYRFGSGFTIVTSQSNGNIAFDIKSIFGDEADFEKEIDSWRTANSDMIFGSLIDRFESMLYDRIEDKKLFSDVILGGRAFCSAAGHNIIRLPMLIQYDQRATTPIAELIKSSRHTDIFTHISVGRVLNRILEDNFTLIQEIYPTPEELSNRLATLRNKHQDTYSKLLDTFKEISGGVGVLAEQNNEGVEQILLVEGDKRYNIDDSASGYYALISILCLLLGKTSGLVAIDEPEIHLHPEMASRLHKMLGKLALQDSVQDIIVVTHSPKFVTHRQITRMDGSRLIMVTRQNSVSQMHVDTEESEPKIKPHIFNPEIFFGRGSFMVEGTSDYHVQRALSDHYQGLFEENNIVLVNCDGKDNIPAHVDLHDRFGIPYHCMADCDYLGKLEHCTKLNGVLEDELEEIGVKDVKTKEDHNVYFKMLEFLKNSKNDKWEKSGIWNAFKKAVRTAGGNVPHPT